MFVGIPLPLLKEGLQIFLFTARLKTGTFFFNPGVRVEGMNKLAKGPHWLDCGISPIQTNVGGNWSTLLLHPQQPVTLSSFALACKQCTPSSLLSDCCYGNKDVIDVGRAGEHVRAQLKVSDYNG